MGTLNSLAASVASNVWLNDSFFTETVAFYPAGDNSAEQTFEVVIDESAFEGTNEAQGDGRTLVESRGEAERKSIIVEMPVSANVTQPQNALRPDRLKRADSSMWFAKRTLAIDSATKRVLFVDKQTKTKRQNRRQE